MASGWDAPNQRPPNWDAPNWRAPVNADAGVAPRVYVRAAFLDSLGRFAKQIADVVTIRLWEDRAEAEDFDVMTIAEFYALSEDGQTAVRNLGSGAGYVWTYGISNA